MSLKLLPFLAGDASLPEYPTEQIAACVSLVGIGHADAQIALFHELVLRSSKGPSKPAARRARIRSARRIGPNAGTYATPWTARSKPSIEGIVALCRRPIRSQSSRTSRRVARQASGVGPVAQTPGRAGISP